MKQFVTASLLAVLLAIGGNEAAGHGTPINAYVSVATGQLAVFDGYEAGELESLGGSDIFTDAPGIGVSSPVNGVAIGEPLHLNVVQKLLFWDGISLTTTDETFVIDWPDDGGATEVDAYSITAQSAYQTGMLWGIYQPQGGTGSWDAHGDYALESPNPTAGIYGVVLQLASPSYISSEPFLVPFVYDPTASLGAVKVAAGIAELQLAVAPLPTADFDRNTLVDALDLQVWQTTFGTLSASQVEGDATGDGMVSGADFLTWQRQFSGGDVPSAIQHLLVVPEPNAFILAAAIVACLTVFYPRFLFSKNTH